MSTIPLPPSPLGQHCSALRNNTLYTFSATGFQSLSLSADSEWTELPPGVPTTGGECVLANRGKKDEALYVIGGSTTEETADTFSGVQRYVFETKKWETITLSDPVAFNLTNHGATYIEDSGELIIFAGTAWPTPADTPSANTYLISTKAPYQITSVVADTPLLKPIVLPWGSSAAVIIGGDKGNRNLNTYTPGKEWKALDKQLDKGIPARGSAGASFMDGDDGTRWLIMFDFTTSPASVLEPKVIDPSSSSSGKLARRQNAELLTGESWPDYNTTLAPTGKRTDTSLAADGDMIVISGGDEETPLLLFNARENSWIDPQDIFSLASTDDKFTTTSKTSTSSTLPSPSSDDATETLTPIAGAPASGGGLNTIQILLVVLGSIIALGLLLTSLFFFLRRSRRTPPPPSDKYTKKHHMSFQDRGASFMKEAGGPPLDLHPARQMDPHEPHPGSPVLTTPVAAARGSGWSRYFSGNNSATNLVPYPTTVRSSYSDFATNKSTPHASHHPNPYLYNAGPGITAGGGRRGSDISLSDIGRDSFSSGIPSEHGEVKAPWSPVSRRQESSLYPPESEGIPSRRDTMDRSSSRYSGPPGGAADNLSWLNLRTG